MRYPSPAVAEAEGEALAVAAARRQNLEPNQQALRRRPARLLPAVEVNEGSSSLLLL